MKARFYQGFGVAFFFLPLTQLSLSEIPKDQFPSASGLFHFIRILIGSGFGTSLAIQTWTRLEIFHHARLAETLTSYRTEVTHFYSHLKNQSSLFTSDISTLILDHLTEQQAYMLALNDLAWIGGWLFLALVPLIYLCKRIKNLNAPTNSISH